ncbi:hypothetical protein VC03_01400 [Sneathia vaginalis]|uniref:Uncharacterized protein n=1 Tax=Sneathia vaginalis TaxID=187101 RepID=A0A0E3UTL0_9FUSO|nr:hypothetical protein [Sneathia vaginalis]AKC95229.1 hypothetical protein VC03_01400 [Sneathia vaginalis]
MKEIIKKLDKLFDWNCKNTDIIKKFPSRFNKDDAKALKSDWQKVGADLMWAVNEYGKKSK